MSFLHSLFSWIAAPIFAIAAFFTPAHSTQQTAAVVAAANTPAPQVLTSAPITPAPTTVGTTPTPQPTIIEKTTILTVPSTKYVTHDELTAQLAQLHQQFAVAAPQTTFVPQNIAAGGNPDNPYAGQSRITNLANVTVSGVSGLSASDLPDLSTTYLSIASTSAARSSLGLSYASNSDVTSGTNIAAWGDSLTASAGSPSYPSRLALLSGYTVYNGGVGGETSSQIATRMLADTTKYSWPTIIWAGRNDACSITTVETNIASMVSALQSVGNNNYLILGILNASTEGTGTATYACITQLNSYLSSTYGSHFIDMRTYLVSQYDPGQPQDVTDHSNDVIPSSLRSDTLHVNAAGAQLVAARINQSISLLQNSRRTLTPDNLTSIFASPPIIGLTTSNAGYFTQIGIGSTSPNSLLTISQNSSSAIGMWLENSSSGSTRLTFSNSSIDSSGFHGFLDYGGSWMTLNSGRNNYNGFRFQTNVGGTTFDRMAILNNGKVGIGTTSPSANLDVSGGSSNASLTVRTEGTSGQSAVLNLISGYSGAPGVASIGAYVAELRLDAGTRGGTNIALTGYTNGSERYRITSTGNFGIGTSSPYAKLSVWGSDSASSTLAFNVVNQSSSTVFAVFNGGNAQLSGTLTQSSDRRLKKDIESLDGSSSLAAIAALDPVMYNWIDPEKMGQIQYGFIAQDVQKVFPNLVSVSPATPLTPDGTLGINYIGILAPLVKAVQMLAANLQALSNKVSDFALNIVSAHVTATIGDFDQVNTKKLCAVKSDGTSVCVTGDQLANVLATQGGGAETQQQSAPAQVVQDQATSTEPVSSTELSDTVTTTEQTSTSTPTDAAVDTSTDTGMTTQGSL